VATNEATLRLIDHLQRISVMSIQLRMQAADSVPTPPPSHTTIFVDTDAVLKCKDSSGRVRRLENFLPPNTPVTCDTSNGPVTIPLPPEAEKTLWDHLQEDE
jgi:hypothetical protein